MTTPRTYRSPGAILALAAALALGVTASSPAGGAAGLAPRPAAGLSPTVGSPVRPAVPPVAAPPVTGAPDHPPALQLGTAQAREQDAVDGLCASATHPELAADLSHRLHNALRGRLSVVGFKADDPDDGLVCEYHQWREFHAASVVKVITLGALLYELQRSHEAMSSYQADLARAMITESDNDAADALWNEIGMTELQRFVTAAGMRHTALGQDDYWGLTEVNPHDELLLLHLLMNKNPVLDAASRAYALKLMAEVEPDQGWGVRAGADPDTTVHLKNGWLPDPDEWDINSIGDFTRRDGDYSIVILTSGNPDMEYGVSTVEAVARRINDALDG
jgi:beta-lactamase family protein